MGGREGGREGKKRPRGAREKLWCCAKDVLTHSECNTPCGRRLHW